MVGAVVDRSAALDSLVALTNRLSIQTVVQFVANQATALLLKHKGVDYTQGHFIGQPRRGSSCVAPNVMRGYLNQPEETARTRDGGWLHTGDVGCFDDDGYLVLVHRVKDMIIQGGENIYPKENPRRTGGRLDVELALLACDWLKAAVLQPNR